MKGIQFRNEEVKMSVDIILYRENPQYFSKKMTELRNKFNSCRIQNHSRKIEEKFLDNINKLSEKNKIMSFTIASKIHSSKLIKAIKIDTLKSIKHF